MSRHARITGKLSRSFGVEDDQDLVVELRGDDTIAIREEPVNRRLRRGEKLDELVLNPRELWDARKAKPKLEDIEARIDKVLARMPLMQLGANDRLAYQAKVWLMREFEREFKPTQQESTLH